MKFHNTWTVYRGIKYHSKLEAAYAEYLDKTKVRWQRQVDLPLKVRGKLIAKMVVDFKVGDKYIEIKGMETDVWKLKYKLMKALYPKIQYEVLKYKDLKGLGIYGK